MKKLLGGILGLVLAGSVQAGNIYLTGHDVLLHSGQNSYDNLILDWLRNGDMAAGDYDIGFVRGFEGSVGSVGVNTLEGFGSITTRDIQDWVALDGAARADFEAFLAGVDVLVIPSHRNCGGCDLNSPDADVLEGLAAEIADFFNDGGDIYANSSANDDTFYNFLPPGVATSGLPIGGSSGFSCTAAGNAIGIVDRVGGGCDAEGSSMINGFPTHNRFVDFDEDFTIFEVRGEEVISIGLLDGVIGTDDISTGPPKPPGEVAAPGTFALLGIALLGLGMVRRRA